MSPTLARSTRLARPQRSVDLHLPAPVGGLNTQAAGSAMPATDAMALWNLVASELGLRSRLGYREWGTGLTGAADNQVRSVFAYHGSARNGSKDRLFACTTTGIYDVTVQGTETLVHTFGTQTGDAGIGVAHAFTTSGGHFLAYCDEINGYLLYTEATDSWAAGSTTGVAAADLVFVTAWKHRLWFVQRDSGNAWYLALNAISGAATQLSLSFGAKPRHGGTLVGLWSWTVDGGAGIDDQLVFAFSGGDIAIYQGTDPDFATTFALSGVWSLGGFPAGRRIATALGGDLLLLTKAGVRPLSQLVSGGDGQGTYLTAKIANLINQLMLSKASLFGWGLHLHPEDNALIITVPTNTSQPTEQVAQQLWNRSWSRYRDLPMLSAATWGGKLYFGTADGRVCVNDGYLDNVLLSDPNSYTPVQWALLTAFSNGGNGRMKRAHLIRPTILSDAIAPNFRVEAKYRYDLAELSPVSGSLAGLGGWDSGLWDSAVWGGEYSASQQLRGATGCGVDVAVAARGEAAGRTIVVGFDLMLEQGGFV